ncbi:hypothetical protein [Qipengyuania atrilutea]|uniref:Uncharacterized protein n=1 Tax=Qipengyuania atrilutea TaxID=2744473 RepID=A0A850H5U2_9SPHN|nr:hypothetical protein [Actirhodobacter atriluteus]NVD46060.1 hypothetical protein [Actirhodobacter atriluteus]
MIAQIAESRARTTSFFRLRPSRRCGFTLKILAVSLRSLRVAKTGKAALKLPPIRREDCRESIVIASAGRHD